MAATLEELAKNLPRKKNLHVAKSYAEMDVDEISWVWENYLGEGLITQLIGRGSVGKTTFIAEVARHVTNGLEWPNGALCPRGGVIMVTPEQGIETSLIPLMMDMGVDLKKIIDCTTVHRKLPSIGQTQQSRFELPQDIGYLRQVIEQQGDTRLICIDPLASCSSVSMGHMSIGPKVLQPLAELAQEKGVAILFVNHMSKGAKAMREGQDDLVRFVTGAPPVLNVPRITLYFNRVMHDDTNVTLISDLKRNEGKPQEPIAYTVLESAEDGHKYVHFFNGYNESLEDVTKGTLPERTRDAILGLLYQEDRPLSPQEMTNTLHIKASTIRVTLRRMVEENMLVNSAYGEYALNKEVFKDENNEGMVEPDNGAVIDRRQENSEKTSEKDTAEESQTSSQAESQTAETAASQTILP